MITIFSLTHCRGDNFLFVTTKPPVTVPADAATMVIIPRIKTKVIEEVVEEN